jgi:hypothetical protein
VRKLFAIVAIALTASANEVSYRSLQSGPLATGTPLHDRGIHGEGQIIAFTDTGVDYDSCFFAEADRSRPPINTTVAGSNVDPNRRKIIAYNFLWSGDNPENPNDYDDAPHGTLIAGAAAGDRGTPIVHDLDDAIAPAAKIVVQDAGYASDLCTNRPGFGCPVNIGPILDQAYRQGARIHSNSWGDMQGNPFSPPTANYPASARDIDAFVYSHPDMLVVFNTGNYGGARGTAPPASSLSAPGSAKNTLQVGGTRDASRLDNDDVLSRFSLIGPTRDGRIKPDVVGPAVAALPTSDFNASSNNCDTLLVLGTSYSAPAVAGAAALVRQYYTDGFYPTGSARVADRFTPSAALLKATIIAAARSVTYVEAGGTLNNVFPAPTYEQGFGFPVLDDALYFPGDASKLRVLDVPSGSGLAAGQSQTVRFMSMSPSPLKVVLVWTDPPGVARAATDTTPQLVNDLDLRVTGPASLARYGNDSLHPGEPDRLNNVEAVSIPQPAGGVYTITISANAIRSGARQNFALVVVGDIADLPATQKVKRHL